MEPGDIIALLGDAAVVGVLVYVMYLFVEGKVFSAKSLEKITVALASEMAARIDEGIVTQFEALNLREERILDEIVKMSDGSDQQLNAKLDRIIVTLGGKEKRDR